MNNIFKIMRKIYKATKQSYNTIKLFWAVQKHDDLKTTSMLYHGGEDRRIFSCCRDIEFDAANRHQSHF